MARIPEQDIERLKNEVSLVRLIGKRPAHPPMIS